MCMLTPHLLQYLEVDASKYPAGKLLHGLGNPILSVGLVDPVEKGQPGGHIGQQENGWRFVGNQRLDPLWSTGEDFEGDNSSRTAAKDNRRLVQKTLDQTPDIIDIGLKPGTGSAGPLRGLLEKPRRS